MKTAVRILMWTHFIYLLLLPTFSVISAVIMFRDNFWTVVLIAGFPPVVMYCLFLANGYMIPDSLPVALFVTFAIPIQIALSVLFFGSGSVWLFLAESAAIEICAFVMGVMFIGLKNRIAESTSTSFVILLFLAGALFLGGVIPHLLSVFYGYGGLSFWIVLFLTSFAIAFWDYTNVYKNVTTAYKRSGQQQNLEMRFGSNFATRLFGVPSDIEMISPLWVRDAPIEINYRVLVFGLGAMFLPIIAGNITAGLYG